MASVFKRGGKKSKGPWYASWFDHNGKRQTKSTKTTDKATAERIAKKFEADAALRRDGVIDPTMDEIGKESKRPIESHLIDYRAKMEAANRAANHISNTIRYIRQICETEGFGCPADITADGVTRFARPDRPVVLIPRRNLALSGDERFRARCYSPAPGCTASLSPPAAASSTARIRNAAHAAP